ncbi:hypothetical protein [Nonomuraea sp. NPDC049684]|uniref:hypothetical protein n=1 Tax=Nonomuraea sp. NPDC049684 TaxID=3364356 RepID=UPI0037BA6B12
MTQDKWSQAHPTAHRAALLGERDAAHGALSRTAFFDHFDLNVDDCCEGYTAPALYHLYLTSRARTRLLWNTTDKRLPKSA